MRIERWALAYVSMFAAILLATWHSQVQPDDVLWAIFAPAVVLAILAGVRALNAREHRAIEDSGIRWRTKAIEEAFGQCDDPLAKRFRERFDADVHLTEQALALLRYVSTDTAFAKDHLTLPPVPEAFTPFMAHIDRRVVVGAELVAQTRAAVERFVEEYDLPAAQAERADRDAKKKAADAEEFGGVGRFLAMLIGLFWLFITLTGYLARLRVPAVWHPTGTSWTALPEAFGAVAERLQAALPAQAYYDTRALYGLAAAALVFGAWLALCRFVMRDAWARPVLLAALMSAAAGSFAADTAGPRVEPTRAAFCEGVQEAYADRPHILTDEMKAFDVFGCKLPPGFGVEKVVNVAK